MKKVISLLLVLVMCIGVLAACGENETTNSTNDTAALENAKAYIKNMYKELHNTMTRLDYDLVTSVTVGDNTFDVKWSVEVTAGDKEAVAVGDAANGVVTVKILIAKPTEEVKYNLTATISDGNGNTVSTSFVRTIGAVEETGTTLTAQTSVEAGVAYKWGMYQANLDKNLYFAGTTGDKDYYLATTEDAAAATDVYLETAEGGFYLYFMGEGNAKVYLDLFKSDTGYYNLRLVAEPGVVFNWNTEYNTLTGVVDGTECYIGTYNEYNTLSCSAISFASSSFPSQMYKASSQKLEQVSEPSVNVAYKWGMYQATLDKTIYFNGTTANYDYYLSTTENLSEAVDVYLEAVEGGYHMYYTNAEGTKMYIDMYVSDNGYNNVRLTTEPTAVLTWNAEYKTLVADLNGTVCYVGTYDKHDTLGCSAISYAPTSYPSNLWTM